MQDNRHFQKGTGCFECRSCGRQTRITGKQGMKTMCPECDEISALENGIDDYGDDDGSSQRRIGELRAAVRSKGGKLSD